MIRSRVWMGLATLLAAVWAVALVKGTSRSSTARPLATAVQQDQHPGYPEDRDKLEATTCRECHMQATPDVYSSWSASKHGVDNVRCFVCHGDFETFKKVPSMETCRSCHADQYDKIMLPAGKTDQTCWSCHPSHGLTVHKAYKTKPSPLH